MQIPHYVTVERFARHCGVSRTAVLRAVTHQKIAPTAFVDTDNGERPLFELNQAAEFLRNAQPPRRPVVVS